MITKISPFANFQILSVLGELSRTLFGLPTPSFFFHGQEGFSKVIDTEPNRRNRKFVGFFGDFKNFFQEFFLTNCINYIKLIVFVLVFTKMGYLFGSSFFYALFGNCNS